MPMLSCNLALSTDAASALHAATCAVVAKVGGINGLPNRIKIGPFKLPFFLPGISCATRMSWPKGPLGTSMSVTALLVVSFSLGSLLVWPMNGP